MSSIIQKTGDTFVINLTALLYNIVGKCSINLHINETVYAREAHLPRVSGARPVPD
jgi:hypothetical protein